MTTQYFKLQHLYSLHLKVFFIGLLGISPGIFENICIQHYHKHTSHTIAEEPFPPPQQQTLKSIVVVMHFKT